MTLCKYFAQGNCRKGNQCRFEHTQTKATTPSQPGPQTSDFVNIILGDLAERPVAWAFSSYGLNFHPLQPNLSHLHTTELSAEELRLQAYASVRATGNIQAYRRVVEGIVAEAERATRLALPKLPEIVADLRRGVSESMSLNVMNPVNPTAMNVTSMNTLPMNSATVPIALSQPNLYQQSLQPSLSQQSLQPSLSQSQSSLPAVFSFGEIPEQPPL